jgi:hypothetical protein
MARRGTLHGHDRSTSADAESFIGTSASAAGGDVTPFAPGDATDAALAEAFGCPPPARGAEIARAAKSAPVAALGRLPTFRAGWAYG